MSKIKAGDNAFIVVAEKLDDDNVVAVVVNRQLKECEECLVDIFAFDNEVDANKTKDKANIVISMRHHEHRRRMLEERLRGRQ